MAAQTNNLLLPQESSGGVPPPPSPASSSFSLLSPARPIGYTYVVDWPPLPARSRRTGPPPLEVMSKVPYGPSNKVPNACCSAEVMDDYFKSAVPERLAGMAARASTFVQTPGFNPTHDPRPSHSRNLAHKMWEWWYGGRRPISCVGTLDEASAEFALYVEADCIGPLTHADKRAQSYKPRVRADVVGHAVAAAKLTFGDAERNEENLGCVRRALVKSLKEATMRETDIASHLDLAVEAVFVPSVARLRAIAVTTGAELHARREIVARGLVSRRGVWLTGERSLPVYLKKR